MLGHHGSDRIDGGAGRDILGGVIDCGPGRDRARVRWIGNRFKVRNCETIGHFCAFGANPGGGCDKPGERPRKP